MLEIVRYETGRRFRGTAVLAVGLGLFSALIVGVFPSIETSGVDFEAYVESLPPAFANAFGVESFGTIEGFLATEFYQFVWVLLFGLYLAYVAGGTVAGRIEDDRLELVLAGPVSRTRVLLETYAALLVMVAVLEVAVFVAVLGSVLAIGESVSLVALAGVHLFSVPYLLVCGAAGLVFSVALDRGGLAERAGIGTIFALFLVDSVTAGTDVDWLGAFSPTRYYDPTAILVRNEYDLAGAVVLFGATVALLALARTIFVRRDL